MSNISAAHALGLAEYDSDSTSESNNSPIIPNASQITSNSSQTISNSLNTTKSTNDNQIETCDSSENAPENKKQRIELDQSSTVSNASNNIGHTESTNSINTKQIVDDPKRILDALLPPEVSESSADPEVVRKITEFHAHNLQGHSFTASLRSKREFHNPYILERVEEHFGLDGNNQYSSNYPLDSYDPSEFSSEKLHEVFREKRRRDKKIKAVKHSGIRAIV